MPNYVAGQEHIGVDYVQRVDTALGQQRRHVSAQGSGAEQGYLERA